MWYLLGFLLVGSSHEYGEWEAGFSPGQVRTRVFRVWASEVNDHHIWDGIKVHIWDKVQPTLSKT